MSIHPASCCCLFWTQYFKPQTVFSTTQKSTGWRDFPDGIKRITIHPYHILDGVQSLRSFAYIYIYTICTQYIYDSTYSTVFVILTLNAFWSLLKQRGMPEWLPEALRFLLWGSQSGWFGLACPAHCTSSLTLLSSVFLCGLSLGALISIIALWILPYHIGLRPAHSPSPSPTALQVSPSRLAGYLHERRRSFG